MPYSSSSCAGCSLLGFAASYISRVNTYKNVFRSSEELVNSREKPSGLSHVHINKHYQQQAKLQKDFRSNIDSMQKKVLICSFPILVTGL